MLDRRSILGAALALALAPTAGAQDYPTKPVTLVVGFSAGGGTDTYARALAAELEDPLGVPVVVANQEGAAGMIAAQAVARTPRPTAIRSTWPPPAR